MADEHAAGDPPTDAQQPALGKALRQALDAAGATLATPLARTNSVGEVLWANLALAELSGHSIRWLTRRSIAAAGLADEATLTALTALRVGESRTLLRVRWAPGSGSSGDLLISHPIALPNERIVEWHPRIEGFLDDAAARVPAAVQAALRGLAHELRNPLAGIRGAAQLLSRGALDEDSRELIEIIGAESSRLSDLIGRLVEATPPGPLTRFSVHRATERVRQLAEARAGWSVALTRDYDPSLPDITGNPDRLIQAIWNLVCNALEADATRLTLRTRLEPAALLPGAVRPEPALRIDIADDGRGVAPELAEQIFVPLVSGRADGTGLGLPLAQQIVREHGGALLFRSSPGNTVFSLLLPLQSSGD